MKIEVPVARPSKLSGQSENWRELPALGELQKNYAQHQLTDGTTYGSGIGPLGHKASEAPYVGISFPSPE